MLTTSTILSFVLETNGIQYQGIISGSITSSFENLSREFSCEVSMPQDNTFPIKLGDECRILIFNIPILTGFVNKIDTALTCESHTIAISGRDRTCDIIDNTLPANLNIGTPISLVDVTKRILDIFQIKNIGVISNINNLDLFSSNEVISVEAGESAFDFLEKYAKKRQVFITTDGEGNIVYDRAENAIISDFINVNKGINQGNVLSVDMTLDDSKRFYKYVMLSQTNSSVTPQTTVSSFTNLGGNVNLSQELIDINQDQEYQQPSVKEETYTTSTSIDDVMRTSRVFYFVSDTTLQDQKSRQDRVDWEKNIRKANGFTYDITLQGFKNSHGEIWKPNMLVTINDIVNDVYANLLIISVEFTLSLDGGTKTKLTLTTPEAFVIKPEQKKKSDTKSKKIADIYHVPLSI